MSSVLVQTDQGAKKAVVIHTATKVSIAFTKVIPCSMVSSQVVTSQNSNAHKGRSPMRILIVCHINEPKK